jgi:hypothetical protein
LFFYSNFTGEWLNNLRDTSKTFQTFFDGCAAAGKERCAFWAKTPSAIRAKWDTLLERIKKEPIPVYTPSPSTSTISQHGCSSSRNASSMADAEAKYGILDSNFLRSTFFSALYSPYAGYQKLALALEALHSSNDPVPLYTLYTHERFKCPIGCDSEPAVQDNTEAGTAIGCQDGPVLPGTVEDNEKFIGKLKKLNGDWWDMWGEPRLRCSGYPKLPKGHFRGGFGLRCLR